MRKHQQYSRWWFLFPVHPKKPPSLFFSLLSPRVMWAIFKLNQNAVPGCVSALPPHVAQTQLQEGKGKHCKKDPLLRRYQCHNSKNPDMKITYSEWSSLLRVFLREKKKKISFWAGYCKVFLATFIDKRGKSKSWHHPLWGVWADFCSARNQSGQTFTVEHLTRDILWNPHKGYVIAGKVGNF